MRPRNDQNPATAAPLMMWQLSVHELMVRRRHPIHPATHPPADDRPREARLETDGAPPDGARCCANYAQRARPQRVSTASAKARKWHKRARVRPLAF